MVLDSNLVIHPVVLLSHVSFTFSHRNANCMPKEGSIHAGLRLKGLQLCPAYVLKWFTLISSSEKDVPASVGELTSENVIETLEKVHCCAVSLHRLATSLQSAFAIVSM